MRHVSRQGWPRFPCLLGRLSGLDRRGACPKREQYQDTGTQNGGR